MVRSVSTDTSPYQWYNWEYTTDMRGCEALYFLLSTVSFMANRSDMTDRTLSQVAVPLIVTIQYHGSPLNAYTWGEVPTRFSPDHRSDCLS